MQRKCALHELTVKADVILLSTGAAAAGRCLPPVSYLK